MSNVAYTISDSQSGQPVAIDIPQVLNSSEATGNPSTQNQDGNRGDNRPTIYLDQGEQPKIVDKLVELTTGPDSPFFDYGDKIVTLISNTSNTALEINITTPSDIEDYLMRRIRFLRPKLNSYVVADLPGKYVNALLKRHPFHAKPAARKLKGIIHAPTLRHDGSLLSLPGYDPKTQLFFDNTEGLPFPAALPLANREEAEKALVMLKVALQEFNFENEADCSVALSAMQTTLIRKQLKAAPAFALTAADVEAGKSFLTDLIATYGTGQLAHPITFSGDQNEERKLLLGALMEGRPVIVFDNVDRQICSAALSTILTQKFFKGRLLGTNKLPKAPTDVTLIFNGINLRANKDISRRALPCVLKPAKQKFELDACRYVADNRVDLVMAGLTIMAAYRAAGCPGLDKLSTFASYADWSEWVRGPLVWLGMADPCARLSWWSRYDHDNHLLIMVLHELYAQFAGKTFTVKDLRAAISNNPTALQSLCNVAQQGSSINAHKLGIWLSNKLGTVRDDLMVIDVGTYQGALQYQVVSTAQPLLQEKSPCIGADLDTIDNVD